VPESGSNDLHAIDAALIYRRAGLSVVPIRGDGSKAAAIRWAEFQSRIAEEAEVRGWFADNHLGVAVVNGGVSGGLETLDCDRDANKIFPEFQQLVESEAPGLMSRLSVRKTPGNGYHVSYRCTEVAIPGNTWIACKVHPSDLTTRVVVIETRGTGGYVLAPGCPANCHPSERLYEHLSGPKLSQVQTITAAEREVLWRAARSFDQTVAESDHPGPAANDSGGLTPGDDYCERGPDWAEILAGWTLVRESGGVRYWRRPGKDAGWSATTGVCRDSRGRELFAVFSSNASPFPGPHGGRNCSVHTKFGAVALLHYGGDFSNAAKELARGGFGQRSASSDGGPEIHLTDLGNARRVVARHGQDVRYCHPTKTWHVWNGAYWPEDRTAAIVRLVKETQGFFHRNAATALAGIGDAGDDEGRKRELAMMMRLLKHALSWEDARNIDRCVKLMTSEPGIPVLLEEFDADHFLLNVLNGTIDLRTGQLREHRRGDLITKMAPVEYNGDAKCPLWESCLKKWMGDNTGLISYLQRVAGYLLTGDVSEDAWWLFFGLGSNGKTTFLKTLLDLLGDYAMAAEAELLLQKKHEAHSTERADLLGKRFVFAAEVDEGRRMAEALMKKLTGHEKIRARKCFKDNMEFEPTHKIILAANNKPTIHGTDWGTWRRIKFVPFVVTITEEEKDTALAEKLKAERAGILTWAVRGCLDWRENGLDEPDEVKTATEEYKADQDTVAAFIAERCFVHSEFKGQVSKVWAAYQEWSGDDTISRKAFSKRMLDRGYPVEPGTGNVSFYKGLMLQIEQRQPVEPRPSVQLGLQFETRQGGGS
jgi:P4 family phage/plasmid primase-like protien